MVWFKQYQGFIREHNIPLEYILNKNIAPAAIKLSILLSMITVNK